MSVQFLFLEKKELELMEREGHFKEANRRQYLFLKPFSCFQLASLRFVCVLVFVFSLLWTGGKFWLVSEFLLRLFLCALAYSSRLFLCTLAFYYGDNYNNTSLFFVFWLSRWLSWYACVNMDTLKYHNVMVIKLSTLWTKNFRQISLKKRAYYK